MKRDQVGNVFGAMALSIVSTMSDAIEKSTAQSIGHCTAVLAVVQLPGLSIDQLRQILRLSHSGTVRVVDKLVSSGLVTRTAGHDGRTVSLKATNAGRDQYRAISKTRLHYLEVVLNALTRGERNQLEAISAKLLGGSASTKPEAQRTCRLCDHSVCFGRGGCPVADGLNTV
jgi:MarR family transcriptional regulator, negative regulator of the multidrug operon emrRAB